MADAKLDFSKNHLLYGDCLDMLPLLDDEVVDLIYLDPPFNSNQNYNMLFGDETSQDSAQITAFADTWYWQAEHDLVYDGLLYRGGTIGALTEALLLMLGRCGMLAYLLFMTERLIELHRVLKPTGSLYLHCDPTASHYLKLVLDRIFGSNMFRNEIVWKRTTSHNDAKRFGRISDRIFYYSRSDDYHWDGEAVKSPKTEEQIKSIYTRKDENGFYRTADLTGPSHGQRGGESGTAWKGYDVLSRGRVWSAPRTGEYAEYIEKNFIPDYRKEASVHKRLDMLDDAGLISHPERGFWPSLKRYANADTGNPIQDIILEPTGFTNYSSSNAEYLGYPTQKPLGLLKKLILASSKEGDLVLDPFCGCGTAVDAAQALGRRWIGMDVSCLAINVITARMQDVHGSAVMADVAITGIPTSTQAARMLFNQNPFEFERWAVGRIGGKPNDRQVGDGGTDGRIIFASDKKGRTQQGIISVKGGRNINPGFVRDLVGTVENNHAAMGVLVTLSEPTKGMVEAANQAGMWQDSFTGQTFPKIQIFTIDQLFQGHRPAMPAPLNPYTKATYAHADTRQQSLI